MFGISTDKAMKPFAYLWIANKQKLEDLPRRRLQHVADAWFGHGAGLVQMHDWGSVLATLVQGRPS